MALTVGTTTTALGSNSAISFSHTLGLGSTLLVVAISHWNAQDIITSVDWELYVHIFDKATFNFKILLVRKGQIVSSDWWDDTVRR